MKRFRYVDLEFWIKVITFKLSTLASYATSNLKSCFVPAADVMHPSRETEKLAVVTQEMTTSELDNLVKTTNYNGFPVVSSHDTWHLVGYIYRRDLVIALGMLCLKES